ncbi:MAG: cation-transporting P-type ATPase [Acidobacteriota bacterium]|jgi:Ca2+-transporting ATPase
MSDTAPPSVAAAVPEPWAEPAGAVLEALEVDPERGLDADEAARRLRVHGANELRAVSTISAREILVRQFKSLIVALLVAAAALSLLFGEWIEGIAIITVLLLNAVLGFVAELRAVRSMEALRRLGRVEVRVRRDGVEHHCPAAGLVPGDIVLLEGGDTVAADLRLIEASKLQADESTLTGESVPVGKSSESVAQDALLAERRDMLFKGTAVTRGSGVGVVVATGMATELGAIADLVEQAGEESTPLERRLAELGRRLVWVTLAIAAASAVSGILAGKDVLLMVETGIALAVAAVPEGLPVVATIALGRGMWRMARRHALINKLSAVETLGATTLILTDKTGTLTENRMTVRTIALPAGTVEVGGESLEVTGEFRRDSEEIAPDGALRELLEAAVLCANATLQQEDDGGITGFGDPLEVALLVAGRKAGLERAELVRRRPEEREEAFDPETKMMATFHADGGAWVVAVKGAAEAVLRHCDAVRDVGEARPCDDGERQRWSERNRNMAADGMRVLAVACKRATSLDEDPYEGLTLLGLVGLLDPPRTDVRPALEACRRAGVRVVMVTGDQAPTAEKIARAVGLVAEGERTAVLSGRELRDLCAEGGGRNGLLETTIFARVDPAQKLEILAMHQRAGDVVAMTGDGVNDAPALKKADIGVAMGKRGTQVAREAADMVLTDDAFSAIVEAIHQGRVIFGNIRQFVFYLLSCNVSEIMIVAGASVLAVPLPILPLQILFLNLVTDVFPALALALGEGAPQVMERPPRPPEESVLRRRDWTRIVVYGLIITAAVLASLAIALYVLGYDRRRAVTISFLTLAAAQLWHVFNARQQDSSFLGNDVVRNPWVWGALALCAGLLAAAVYLPVLSTALRTSGPGATGWALVMAMSLLPLAAGQFWAGLTNER